jgi:pimeloyl-ACP methyl ester carboxylesterase
MKEPEPGAEGELEGDFGGTFPYEPRYVEAGEVRLHYAEAGPADAAPILMLHGNPTWSYMYRRPLAELAERGHRAIAFDHLGFGRSDKPPRRSRYGLARHVENAIAVLDELDLHDVTLVMHDWGGPIGLGAALERLDRVRALVAMNTWAWELPSFLPPFLREFRREGLGEILVLGGNLLVESIPGGMASRRHDPEMMAAYRAPFPDYWSRLAQLCFQRDIPLSEADGSAPLIGRIHSRLEELDLPLQLVWGVRDPVFQRVFIDQWQELFPGAGLVEVADAAHYLVEDRPDVVTDAVHDFVSAL